jgi:hypothetical protein
VDGSRSLRDFGVSGLQPLQSSNSFGENSIEGCINTPYLITFTCSGDRTIDLGTKELLLSRYSAIRDSQTLRYSNSKVVQSLGVFTYRISHKVVVTTCYHLLVHLTLSFHCTRSNDRNIFNGY